MLPNASTFKIVCYTAVYNQDCLNVFTEEEIYKLVSRKKDLKLKEVARHLSNNI